MVKVLLLLTSMVIFMANLTAKNSPIVIAHRGACGYLPEHFLANKAMAHAQGADFWEQDVVMTKDDQAIILHDLYLERVTNVAKIFPGRQRKDGRYYAIDFTLEEIQKLSLNEEIDVASGKQVRPNRYPGGNHLFKIHTLQDEIEFLLGLNFSTERSAGLFVEIKHPFWHEQEGKDLVRKTMEILRSYGYDQKGKSNPSPIFIETFDFESLRRIKNEFKTDIPLVQLIGDSSWSADEIMGDRGDYDYLRSPKGLQEIATFAVGASPWLPHVIEVVNGKARPTSFVADAHKLGLKVTPYTFRKDDLPVYAKSFDELHDLFFKEAQVDGVFTDFTDLTVAYLKKNKLR